MKKLTEARANELKAQGIEYVIAVIKQHYNTRYVKYESLDSILSNGGKMAAAARSFYGYKVGINYNHLPADVKDHSIAASMI